MARNSIVVHAPPDAVYGVLTDAGAYASWVVGAKQIRGADRGFPRPGTRFHHTVGGGPVAIEDESQVTRAQPDRRFELEVRFRPVGTAHVAVELEPRDGGRQTLVTMTETPTGGPTLRLWNWAVDAVTHVRNAISLRRLRNLAESRR